MWQHVPLMLENKVYVTPKIKKIEQVQEALKFVKEIDDIKRPCPPPNQNKDNDPTQR